MNRSLVILIGVLALGTALFTASFVCARKATVACCANPADDLSWLQMEFHLSDADMVHIRHLHEGYQPQCAEMCMKIAAAKKELYTMVGNSTNLTAAAKAKLDEIADLRAQCQQQMLQHFVAVSQVMPPAEGQRYLAEMKKMTLGNHEQMEQSMSGDTGHEHHH